MAKDKANIILLFLEIFREVFRFLGKFKSLKVFGKRKIVLEDCYDVLYNHTKKALGMLDTATAYLPTLRDNKAYSYYHT